MDKYDRAFIVAADNVGSKQFQDIRRVSLKKVSYCSSLFRLPCCCLGARKFTAALRLQGLREHSVVLMGKNTLMKRCIRLYAERTKEEKWNVLLDYLVGNVGIIFTNVSTCCL